jgi:hypothetical protein
MTLIDAPGGHARVTLDSRRDAGWRSVVLRRVTNERTVEQVELPAELLMEDR